MPGKKKTKKAVGKTAAKKMAKKSVKKATKKALKKTVASGTPKQKSVAKKKPPKPIQKQRIEIERTPEPPKVTPPPPPPEPKKKLGIDCEHCDATGICAAGTPYDKSHGQTFGAKVRMTSCPDCLEAAGEHRNSKKLVKCRICEGDGKI